MHEEETGQRKGAPDNKSVIAPISTGVEPIGTLVNLSLSAPDSKSVVAPIDAGVEPIGALVNLSQSALDAL